MLIQDKIKYLTERFNKTYKEIFKILLKIIRIIIECNKFKKIIKINYLLIKMIKESIKNKFKKISKEL